eukprot:TRINITY_DN687_c0_g1_i25.p2 TRINITY_DN687_c0_g1~~TRINITY_DN687_c0_g1_i25.p2  ORF type:complete len:166 (+),score=38.26 TRINITY_DN687_c0_g1_i25:212-709(+)
MEITPDLGDWPIAQFKDNIEDKLDEQYDIDVLDDFPETAEVLAVLKSSDSKLRNESKVLILYRHEGKGLEGIIEVEKVAAKNDFFSAWDFFTTVESRSSPDTKPKIRSFSLPPILKLTEEKADMEIIPNAEIVSTTYACLIITSTDNENTKTMFEAIKKQLSERR